MSLWGRAIAGVVPGFFVAAAGIGLATWLAPGGWRLALVPALVAFFPLWIAVIAASFAFASARRAWCTWSLLAAGGFAALAALRALEWAR